MILVHWVCYVSRSWVDYSFEGNERQRLVNQVLSNLVHLHHPGVMTLPENSCRELATTWENYQFAPDGSYGTAQGAVAHDFWVSIFSIYCFFFITPSVLMCFWLHIIFTVTFSVAQGGQPPGACTWGLQCHCSKGHEGCYFICSHSSKQYKLQGSPMPENEQEAGFLPYLLDRGAIQPGKCF
jgi:hypothetical protein